MEGAINEIILDFYARVGNTKLVFVPAAPPSRRVDGDTRLGAGGRLYTLVGGDSGPLGPLPSAIRRYEYG